LKKFLRKIINMAYSICLKNAKKKYIKYVSKAKLVVNRKIILGADSSSFDNWVSTDIEILNITSENDWKDILTFGKLKAILMEHVLEHLTEEDAEKGLRNIFKYLKRGGYVRIAVPDGFHPDFIMVV